MHLLARPQGVITHALGHGACCTALGLPAKSKTAARGACGGALTLRGGGGREG